LLAVAPDVNNKRVLSIGILKGLIDAIPTGGHSAPIKILGDKLELKKDQKTAAKRQTSEQTNKSMPTT